MSDEELGNNLSHDGVRNAFHHRCDIVGHARPFAVCAHICSQVKRGLENPVYPECIAAIKKEVCPALDMIAEEKATNKVIYFVERVKGVAVKLRDSIKSAVQGPKDTDYNKSVMSDVERIDYSEAINASLEAMKNRPTFSDESPLEIARKLKGTRND